METQRIENVAPHSVQLSTNAKGKVQIEVKVYAAEPLGAAQAATRVLADTKRLLIEQGFEVANG